MTKCMTELEELRIERELSRKLNKNIIKEQEYAKYINEWIVI